MTNPAQRGACQSRAERYLFGPADEVLCGYDDEAVYYTCDRNDRLTLEHWSPPIGRWGETPWGRYGWGGVSYYDHECDLAGNRTKKRVGSPGSGATAVPGLLNPRTLRETYSRCCARPCDRFRECILC